MIHMRAFNEFELRNIKFLVNNQVNYATVQITETGLKKGILDATAPVRAYFKEQGIHDYDYQLQGELGKRLVETYILDEIHGYETQTSLYRPVTKKGDPRMWVRKAKSFLNANDIFAIIAHDKILYVVNLTTVDIPKVCLSPLSSPLKDLVNEISCAKQSTSEELLGLIQEKMSDWLPAEKLADTGIGRTVESVLGIPMNASKEPDYKGIELKSHRSKSNVRGNLFTQAPDWSLSKCKSGKEIVAKYGYIPKNYGHKTLHVTLTAKQPNPQGLGLRVELLNGFLEADEFLLQKNNSGEYPKVDDVAVWRLMKLHDRLLTKHKETFWIDVETRMSHGLEYFRCTEIEHTKNPLPAQFDILLDQGEITVDFLLSRASGGDTYSFKIRPQARNLLFPESDQYIIAHP